MDYLKEQLTDEPQRVNFFQAMRLLRILAVTADGSPPKRPVGEDYNPAEEIVRFRTLPTLRFPLSPISSISPMYAKGNHGATYGQLDVSPQYEMVVTFMGLTGPHGVLPRHYTQLLISRIREKDSALRDFLDLFNHRVISLFYRAWEKYHFPIVYESTALQLSRRGEDLFTRCLYGITGYGLPGVRNRLQASDELFLYYGGLFAHRPPTSVSLQTLLIDILRLPTRVLQFQGQWLYLTLADRSSLPSSQQPGERNNQLGRNLVIGRRVWDVQNKFRIRIGPLTYAQFRRFMPDGDQLARICQIVRSYVGPGYDFDVQPILEAAGVPQCCLGDGRRIPPRLGWNTWLRANPMPQDAQDAVFVHSGNPSCG